MYDLQRGGMQFLFTKYKTLRDLRTAMADLNSKGILPIPSQKRGTCVMDGITVSLWYSDLLGEYLWNKYVFANEGLVDTHDVEKGPRTLEEMSAGILPAMAYRVARIMESMSIESRQRPGEPAPPPIVSRPKSAQGPIAIPTGEFCSNLVYILEKKEENGDPQMDRPNHAANVKNVIDVVKGEFSRDDTLKGNVKFVNSGVLEEVLKTGELSDMECVAATISIEGERYSSSSTGIHLVAIVRINGIWTFVDNNIGVGIAVPELKTDDIFTGKFLQGYTVKYDKPSGQWFQKNELYITLTDGRIIKKTVLSDTHRTKYYENWYEQSRINPKDFIFVNPRILASAAESIAGRGRRKRSTYRKNKAKRKKTGRR